MVRIVFLFIVLFHSISFFAKDIVSRTYQIPVMLPPVLAGNFGELRPNHFHSGIDFKTKGSIGHPIYSFDEGWVSRIVISPRGYGRALYVTHYNGLTTVYAHLETFSDKINKYTEDYQYSNETFVVDTNIEPGVLPVKRGEIIAKSGNTGSSGGPHLHFEIRDTESEDPIDPLPFFVNKIKDTTKPDLRLIRFYPIDGKINNSETSAYSVNPIKKEGGLLALNNAVTAWGKIGIGYKAYDKMDSTYNVFGVKYARLYLNDTLIFSIKQDRFSFAQTRYINSLMDYKDWYNRRSYVSKLFREPGNMLNIYGKMINDGYIDINEEKDYNFRLELTDNHGNTTKLPFTVTGKKTELNDKKEPGEFYCKYDTTNIITRSNFWFSIPKGALYNDLDLDYSVKFTNAKYSDIHSVHSPDVPLHSYCEITIPLNKDNVEDKSKYYIATDRNGRPTFNKTVYVEGSLIAKVRTFGDFYAVADTVPPVLTPLNPQNWGKTGQVRYKMTDAMSGVKTWKGEIDGNFALFEYDEKQGYISYKIDKKRVQKGKNHTLRMTLTDNCDNITVDERNFYW